MKKFFQTILAIIFLVLIIVGFASFSLYRQSIYGVPFYSKKIQGADWIEVKYNRPRWGHATESSNGIYDRSKLFFQKITDTLVDFGGVRLSPNNKFVAFIEVAEETSEKGQTIYNLVVYDIDKKKKEIVYKNKVSFEWLADSTLYLHPFLRINNKGDIIEDKSKESKFNRPLPDGKSILYTTDNKNYILHYLDGTEETLASFDKPYWFEEWSPRLDYLIFERRSETEDIRYYYQYNLANKNLKPLLTIESPYNLFSLDFNQDSPGSPEENAWFLDDGKKIKISLFPNEKVKMSDPSIVQIEQKPFPANNNIIIP